MRTTLNLDDAAREILLQFSQSHSIDLGEAASELIRRGAPAQMRMENGFCVAVLPPGGEKITSERVKQLLEDEI